MSEKSLIFGISYAVDSLIMALIKEKISLDLDKDYYVNIDPPPIPDPPDFGNSVVSGLFVDVTEDLVKATLSWLRNREKENMEKPNLKFCINGNLLNINIQDMEILLKFLNDCTKRKKQNNNNASK
jgi:hypothetical protein